MWKYLPALSVVSYLLVSHVAVMLDRLSWASSYLVFVILLLTTGSMVSGRRLQAMLWGGVFLVACWVLLREQYHLLLYVPPIIINLGLLFIFARSLRSGNTPFITRYARLIDGDLSNEEERYTRKVTWWWTGFFLVLAVECIVLSLFAPLEIWSLFTNLLNYVFLSAMFVVEFMYRKHAFPDKQGSFYYFMRRLVKIRPAQLLERG